MNRSIKNLTLVLMLLVSASYTHAQTSKSIAQLQKEAAAGNAESQSELAKKYYEGKDVAKDVSKTFYWLQKAAHNNNAYGQLQLGNCYYDGTGTTVNFNNAFYWYQKAADNNNATAQSSLGSCYQYGDGTGIDFDKAFYWFQKAANNNSPKGQYNFGVCYESGIGVKIDLKLAYEWFQKAADNNNKYGQNALGYCYYFGKGTAVDYDKAMLWFQKAADNNNADAQYSLGNCYYFGKGTAVDYDKAIQWFQKAADNNNADAQYSLGNCYYFGKGTAVDYDKAIQWFQKSADNNNADAQYSLGICYFDGKGTSVDYNKAFYWLQKAANNNSSTAMFSLGVMYENAYGVPVDYDKAVEWYKKAKDAGINEVKQKLSNLLTLLTKHCRTDYGDTYVYRGGYVKHKFQGKGEFYYTEFTQRGKNNKTPRAIQKSSLTACFNEDHIVAGSTVKFTFPNGDVYTGGWTEGMNGHGVIHYADGRVLEGEFNCKDEVMYSYWNYDYSYGHGTPNNWAYSKLLGSKLSGKCTISWPNGSTFEGEAYNFYVFDRGGSYVSCSPVFLAAGTLKTPNEPDYIGLLEGDRSSLGGKFEIRKITKKDFEYYAERIDYSCSEEIAKDRREMDGYYNKQEEHYKVVHQQAVNDILNYAANKASETIAVQSKLEKNYQQATESANDKRIRETQKSYKMMNDIEQKKQASSSSNSSSESRSAKSQSSSNSSGSSNNTKQIVLTKVEGNNTPQKEDHSKDKLTLHFVYVGHENTYRYVEDKSVTGGQKQVGKSINGFNVITYPFSLTGEAWQFGEDNAKNLTNGAFHVQPYCEGGKKVLQLDYEVGKIYMQNFEQRKSKQLTGDSPSYGGLIRHEFRTQDEAMSYFNSLQTDYRVKNLGDMGHLFLIPINLSLSSCN